MGGGSVATSCSGGRRAIMCVRTGGAAGGQGAEEPRAQTTGATVGGAGGGASPESGGRIAVAGAVGTAPVENSTVPTLISRLSYLRRARAPKARVQQSCGTAATHRHPPRYLRKPETMRDGCPPSQLAGRLISSSRALPTTPAPVMQPAASHQWCPAASPETPNSSVHRRALV